MKSISFEDYGLGTSRILYQLDPEQLHQMTLERGMCKEASNGALAVNTGEFTGRSPMDRFIANDNITKDKVWWGDINIPFSAGNFNSIYDKVIA